MNTEALEEHAAQYSYATADNNEGAVWIRCTCGWQFKTHTGALATAHKDNVQYHWNYYHIRLITHDHGRVYINPKDSNE